ncbi:ROK family protein [Streptomyces sp. B6B3]|uniref:ROK family protein n=1 Tax=Streptomyces sp. B6B3 TaxID=3153570 RepID=UPI00325F24D8
MTGSPTVPVLEVGGTHVTAALVDLLGPDRAEVRGRVRRPLDAHGPAADVLGALLDCAAALPEIPAGAVWGVAVPGPFDYATGVARYADVGKFDALNGVDVGAALRAGLPGRPAGTAFRNDAHAFLIGEAHAGAARGHRRCAGITLGTGVGSAFLADGRIRVDEPGLPPEGRADLLTLHGRPLEDSVSRRAILARYGGPGGDADVDVRDVADRARAGEERAARVLAEAFAELGTALAPSLDSFGASVLVVGGSMARSWDLVAPALRDGLGGAGPAVTAARLGEDALLIGAALAAARGHEE